MKIVNIIVSLLALMVSLSGCERELSSLERHDGESTISITLNTESVTKAGTAKDGDVMNNVYLWIADDSGKIVYKGSFVGTTVSGDKFSFQMEDDKKSAKAQFENVERGDYTMYIAANLPASLSSLAPALIMTLLPMVG